jgi:hypothetical protein
MTAAHDLIIEHYAMQCAKRSKVPLINHINEGLIVLDAIGATQRAKDAFCIHPMLQHDSDLSANWKEVASVCDSETILMAMEYRSVANEFLSDKMDLDVVPEIRLSPLLEVNQMLIADKVQNYKDFTKYHYGTHARSEQLNNYFHKWLEALDIDLRTYTRLYKLIDASKT